MENFHGTTIVTVRRNNAVVVGGDGQVTLGDTIMKGNATKVRKVYQDKVIAGFAGATADAFTLLDRFEGSTELAADDCVALDGVTAVPIYGFWNGDTFEPETAHVEGSSSCSPQCSTGGKRIRARTRSCSCT